MGKLIVLEGLDGCGKTTQTERLVKKLLEEGKKVYPISFPMYDRESSALLRMYLGGALSEDPDDINGYAASMFFAADRYITYIQDWKKAYDDPDTIVFATRYTTANAYHQLSKLPREKWDDFLNWLFDFEFGKLGLPTPDQVFLLEMPADVSRRQTALREKEGGSKQDIHEKDADYLNRCREAAVYVAEKLHWNRINCFRDGKILPIETITEMIRKEMVV